MAIHLYFPFLHFSSSSLYMHHKQFQTPFIILYYIFFSFIESPFPFYLFFRLLQQFRSPPLISIPKLQRRTFKSGETRSTCNQKGNFFMFFFFLVGSLLFKANNQYTSQDSCSKGLFILSTTNLSLLFLYIYFFFSLIYFTLLQTRVPVLELEIPRLRSIAIA